MAHRIRRTSMEHLELYDLDKLTILLPPPVPTTCKHRYQRSTFERYQFLCDMKRHKTDPVYAATPMFTIIPQSKHIKHPRQILGAYVPPGIIKPLSTTSPKSPEPESDRIDNDAEEEHESSDEDDDRNLDDDDKDERDESSSSSSSSNSSDKKGNDNFLDDDDDTKGIVEQIFNRDKK